MNKLGQLVPDLIKKQRKAAFLTVLFIILASVIGVAGYAMLAVGSSSWNKTLFSMSLS